MSADPARPRVAIVDYRLGNLFSVRQACAHAGMDSVVTSRPDDLWSADAVILPGVGAFGHAMRALHDLGLDSTLVQVARSGKPTVGICLGFQLLFSESHEFGTHAGLGLIEGVVEHLRDGVADTVAPAPAPRVKAPNMGWQAIRRAGTGARNDPWAGSLLSGLEDGTQMYFVHSFYVLPARPDSVLATTRYDALEYACAAQSGAVFGCQFHPERSGADGLHVYANLARLLGAERQSERDEGRPVLTAARQ
jgi:glutamine amidotransferase